MTEPTIEQITAERELWIGRALSMLDILNAVEYLFECESGRGFADPHWLQAYNDLRAEFNAWRKLVEANIPTDWRVAGECGPRGFELDEGDVPF